MNSTRFETLESRRMFSVFAVTNVNDTGAGSLHEAIDLSNANPGKDTIEFNLGGSDRTIRLVNNLPRITDPVIIDGSSQPGFSGAPLVKIRAAFAGGIGPQNIFDLTAGDSTIRGLCLTGAATAIWIHDNGGNTIVGNYIGTDLSGKLNEGNRTGIMIETNNNLVGGASDADRNIIACSALDGIVVAGSGNAITNNFIGTDVTGTAPLGNQLRGIDVQNGVANTITNNVISANAHEGIRLIGITRSNVIRGNKIGTDVTGKLNLGNGMAGVRIEVDNTSGHNVIGGVNAGEANAIAFNAGAGVEIVNSNSSGNTIRGNSIFANTGLSIDLGSWGQNENDAGDVDTGPNGLLNTPDLRTSFNFGKELVLSGTYAGSPDSTYTLDFYLNPKGSTGSGQARTYLGSATVSTGSSGSRSFTVLLPTVLIPGQSVTATATDANGNTSELSIDQKVSYVGLFNGRLAITGTPESDRFTVTVKGPKLRVSDGNTLEQFNLSAVDSISASLDDGDDAFAAGSGVIAVSVDGGRGNDRISGGDGNDTLVGGDGNDKLAGLAGTDWLYGGRGNDALAGGNGNDKLYGQDGNDVLIGEQGVDILNGGSGTDRRGDVDKRDRLIDMEP